MMQWAFSRFARVAVVNCALILTVVVPASAGSIDIGGLINSVEDQYQDNINTRQETRRQISQEAQQRNQAASQASRDRFAAKMNDSRYTYCWGISDEDARAACLEEPWLTESEDARKVLLGDCYGMSNWAQNSGYMQVCAYPGKNSCSAISNSNISSACYSCDGSKRWVATAAAGHVFQCF